MGTKRRPARVVPPQVLVAMGELGVSEIFGPGSNPRIDEYIDSTPRGRWSHTDAVSWCGALHTWVSLQCGLRVPPDGHRARAWLEAGKRTKTPELGDTAVMRLRRDHIRQRSRTGSARGGYHVGWYLNTSRGAPVLISGNVDDRVGIDWYAPTVWEVVAFIEPLPA